MIELGKLVQVTNLVDRNGFWNQGEAENIWRNHSESMGIISTQPLVQWKLWLFLNKCFFKRLICVFLRNNLDENWSLLLRTHMFCYPNVSTWRICILNMNAWDCCMQWTQIFLHCYIEMQRRKIFLQCYILNLT